MTSVAQFFLPPSALRPGKVADAARKNGANVKNVKRNAERAKSVQPYFTLFSLRGKPPRPPRAPFSRKLTDVRAPERRSKRQNPNNRQTKRRPLAPPNLASGKTADLTRRFSENQNALTRFPSAPRPRRLPARPTKPAASLSSRPNRRERAVRRRDRQR